ncbi:MAG: HEAT repeat domain-containing protein [Planctomycetaceae bacterium]
MRSICLTIYYLTLVIWVTISTVRAADQKETAEERIAATRLDLKHPDAAVRLKAIGTLIHSDISEQLFPEMRSCLADADGMVRSTAATAIGNLGTIAVPAIPDLVQQLQKDKVKESRETAARALGRIGKAAPEEKSLIAPLKSAAEKDVDPVTRTVAHGALAMIDVDVPGQIAALRKYLHHKEPLVRMKGAHALGMIGLPAKAASAEIVKVLETEPDEHRRGYVARALGNVGDPVALPALYAALKAETHDGTKGEMRGAISRLGGKVPD